MKILLVYPPNPESFWSFAHVLPLVSRRSAFPPLGLLTVAAMLPRSWELRLVDCNVTALSDADLAWADHVFLSGMIVHREGAHAIAQRCAERGVSVVAGGPLFTTGHAEFPEIPCFVLGEAEGVIEELVRDLERGELRSQYRADAWPDVRTTPVPRWDLVELADYVTMPVQFSRGCPYDCEFCDIVVMNGRTPRTKSPEQVLAEIETLVARGWKDMIFLVDDNFIGNRKHARELLRSIVAWRAHRPGSLPGFLTEASVNLADDPELLELMVQAGFKKVFVGLETPLPESLAECGKTQNKKRDLASAVATLQRAGLEVMGGFIVGFDNDPPEIFGLQYEFIQRSGVATAMVGLLTALPQTALHRRLAREGRLLGASAGNNTGAVLNFVPRLDRELLIEGYRALMRRLYEPASYYRRIRNFLARYRPRGPQPRLAGADVAAFLRSLWLLGVRERGAWRYWSLLLGTLLRRPRALRAAIELAILGHHFRTVARSI